MRRRCHTIQQPTYAFSNCQVSHFSLNYSLSHSSINLRSLDLAARNDAERIEVLKLVRKLLMLSPSNFDTAISRSLVSLANGGIEEKDRMLRACLAILCELGISMCLMNIVVLF